MLLNPRLSAAEAQDLGLVSAVYREDEFDTRVGSLAATIAAGPVRAYGVAKSLLNLASGMDRLDYHLDQELESLARSADAPEFQEGIAAFFEKREPRFL